MKKGDRETISKLPRTTVTQHPTLPQHCLFLADDCFGTQKEKQNTVANVSFPIHHQSLRSDSFSHCACCWILVLTVFYFSHCISCSVATLTAIHISFCHPYKFRTLLSVSATARDTAVALMFSIWYCARHCSGPYVQYLVLCETLQWLIIQICSVCISVYTYSHDHNNVTISSDIYNIQLHVSALYIGHHQVVQRTY